MNDDQYEEIKNRLKIIHTTIIACYITLLAIVVLIK